MVRVTVNEDITVCPNGHYLQLAAGQAIEGPVAEWLAEHCRSQVTIGPVTPAADPAGALSATLTATTQTAQTEPAKGAGKTAKS